MGKKPISNLLQIHKNCWLKAILFLTNFSVLLPGRDSTAGKKSASNFVGQQRSQSASVVVVVHGYHDTTGPAPLQHLSCSNNATIFSNSLHLLCLLDFCPRPNLIILQISLTSPFFPSLAISRHSPFGYQHPYREPDQWHCHGHG